LVIAPDFCPRRVFQGGSQPWRTVKPSPSGHCPDSVRTMGAVIPSPQLPWEGGPSFFRCLEEGVGRVS
jgi:hypothetical protein